MASAVQGLSSQLPAFDICPPIRMPYPSGFVRAGGLRLPLRERQEALREIAERTRGMGITEVFVIVGRIVREAWDSVAKQPSDIAQLSYGTPGVAVYHDPDAHAAALNLLVRLPAIPVFAGVLGAEEAELWGLSFAGSMSQREIGAAMGKPESAVSRILRRAVAKLNVRYRELREQDAVPIEISAWVRETEPSHGNCDLAAAVSALRRRDRLLRAGSLKDARTGCNDLDSLDLRAA